MARRKLRQELQRAVTARFPLDDYAAIVQVAESRGATVADVLRHAWQSYQQQQDFQQLLQRLEARLTKRIFEACVAAGGLDESERREALSEYKAKISHGGAR